MRKVIKIIVLILVIAVVAAGIFIGITKRDESNYVLTAMNNAITAIKDGTWHDVEPGGFGEISETPQGDGSEAPQVTFKPGDYAGVSLQSVEDVVNYYNTVYNATKAETATYTYSKESGKSDVFYKALVEESLELKPDSLLVDGSPNAFLNKAAPGLLTGIFKSNVNGLPPCANRDPNQDVDEKGASLMTSRVTPEDILACGVVDNGDGTLTMTLIPQTVNMSYKGMDAQGHFFNSLGAIDGAIEGIGVKWAEGTTADNCKVVYEDGYAEVKIDTASGKIVEGYYHMVVNVDITHANLLILNNKSATLTLYYDNKFPASDEYLLEKRDLVRS